tara:strand:- start:1058 stop:1213 length:156 start_codon:yes stop_codon:yes gene_type:complete
MQQKPVKKLTPKQQKIAQAAAPTDQITGADFAALRKAPKKKSVMGSFGKDK